jgi:hypothetical protein
MGYTSPSDGTKTDGSTAYGSHISQNAGDTVFWAGSPKNTQLRVFSMAEGSNQYSSRDIDIDSWPNGTITLNAPDGVDNFSFGWPGNAITGATPHEHRGPVRLEYVEQCEFQKRARGSCRDQYVEL